MARRTAEEKAQWAAKKTQIVSSYNIGKDWRALAHELSVPEGAAYRWVSVGDLADSRGGRRFNKVNNDHVQFMVSLIEENNRISLQEIVDQIRVRFELQLSKPSVWKHLDMVTYTLKKIRFEGEKPNTLENKLKRKKFGEKLLQYQAQNLPICFMDESNINIHILRRKCRSLRRTRCTTIASGGYWVRQMRQSPQAPLENSTYSFESAVSG